MLLQRVKQLIVSNLPQKIAYLKNFELEIGIRRSPKVIPEKIIAFTKEHPSIVKRKSAELSDAGIILVGKA